MQLSPTGIAADELPAELTELMAEMQAEKLIKIEAIGKEVAAKREEAVKGRRLSGIEKIWEEDLEYYQGIDDANRDQVPWVKSPSATGGLSRKQVSTATRCTSFFNITRQFCDSASARMGDILLPAGDWNFLIKPTPVQDVQEGTKQNAAAPPGMLSPPAQEPQSGLTDKFWGVQPQQNVGTTPADNPMGNDPIQSQPEQLPTAPAPDPVAVAKAARAEAVIHDWLVESRYHTEVRKCIESAAIIGVGVLKGPFPTKRKSKKVVEVDGTVSMEIVNKTAPSTKFIDPEDFFPDPACGEDIHCGSYVLERDRLTARKLKDLKGVKGYLSDQIDKVLDEGPNKCHYAEGGYRAKNEQTKDDDTYEVWHYTGLIDVASLGAMNVKMTEKESEKNMLPAVVTLVNDTPIKAFINPLDSGDFPYDVMPWQRMAGSWAGIGVSRQMRTPQSMLNAGGRMMMDNAGLSGKPQIVIRQGAVVPADGKWELTPGKMWFATEQADVRSVADAIQSIVIPMVQAELLAIIQLAKSMAEEATGVMFLLQGQQGSAPDTVGGMELLHRNASAFLRRQGRVYDELVTEPHIGRYYEWLMMDPSVPADCKGDMQIEAIGSTAMVEREIQALQAMQILNLSINPAYGLDPAKAMTETLKSLRMMPDKWTMDPDKAQQLAQQQPQIPQIEVAKINAEIAEKRLDLEKWKAKVASTTTVRKAEMDMDRDALYADTMARRDQTTREIRIEEMRLKREMSIMDYTNRHNISLEQVKAKLADSAMKLRVQKQLARAGAVAKQVATPATEPPQHARNGRAFQE